MLSKVHSSRTLILSGENDSANVMDVADDKITFQKNEYWSFSCTLNEDKIFVLNILEVVNVCVKL